MPLGLVGFDKRAMGEAVSLIGIDEAGRGCLAGPVVAAAIHCVGSFYTSSWCRRNSRGVDDSKRLSAEKRAAIVERFARARERGWIRIGIGVASIEEIEAFNIYHATTLSMRRALEQVMEPDSGTLWEKNDTDQTSPRSQILIDGRPIRSFPHPHRGVVKGDQRSLAMALAGIHAKEWRDGVMLELDAAHPEYGFSSHKGYGTRQHVAALREFGPVSCHRPSFLKKVLSEKPTGYPLSQDSLF